MSDRMCVDCRAYGVERGIPGRPIGETYYLCPECGAHLGKARTLV